MNRLIESVKFWDWMEKKKYGYLASNGNEVILHNGFTNIPDEFNTGFHLIEYIIEMGKTSLICDMYGHVNIHEVFSKLKKIVEEMK